MRIPFTRNDDPSRRAVVTGLTAFFGRLKILPQCTTLLHTRSLVPLPQTAAKAASASAGYVERLMYHLLAAGVRKGRITIHLNGRIPSVEEARGILHKARESGKIRKCDES